MPELMTAAQNISKYYCLKCDHPLRTPVQSLGCGHRYCSSCFEDILRDDDKARCIYPNCEDNLSRERCFIDKAIRKEFSNVNVDCRNAEKNCDWRGTIDNYYEHYENCDFGTLYCPNDDCDATYLRKDQKSHEETCRKRVITCSFCQGSVKFDEKESHLETCDSVPVKCPDCQKEMVNRRELDTHSHSVTGRCPNTKIQCRFSALGCNEVIIRSKKKIHMKTAIQSHQLMLLEHQLRLQDGTTPTSSANNEGSNETIIQKVNDLEGLCKVLHGDVQRSIKGADAARQESDTVKQLRQELDKKEISIRELRWRLDGIENTSYDGTLLWRIDNVNQLRQEAQDGTCTSIYSSVFFAGRRGYKLCARLYLNGDGVGQGQYVSLFLVVLRGRWDPLLPWPFAQTVTFELLNQSGDERHITESFRPATNSVSFKRPVTEMNIASGCPQFCPLQVLTDHKDSFIKDDIMFIKITVNLTGLPLY